MTQPSPLVAIPAYHLAAGRVLGWSRGGYAVPEGYVAAVLRASGRPVLVPPTPAADPYEVLGPFDGLLLAGSGDVDPARYGASPHPSVYGVDPERAEAELALVKAAIRAGLPTLVICRGMQVLNVALGGTLHQHLPELEGMDLHGSPVMGASVVHDVKVADATLLGEVFGNEARRCTSHHHQGIDRLAEGLVAVAWSSDGLVEGVELVDGTGWLVGVQWHPEMSAAEDPWQQALFACLVDRAREHAHARPGMAAVRRVARGE